MPKPPTAAVVATGLVGGFALARYSGRRELGGLFYAGCGAWCAREWARTGGPALTTGLGLTYVAAFGGSHPLAKRIGAWPANRAKGRPHPADRVKGRPRSGSCRVAVPYGVVGAIRNSGRDEGWFGRSASRPSPGPRMAGPPGED